MPLRPPRLCSCGRIVPGGERCLCQVIQERARKARHDARRPNARARGYDRAWEAKSRLFLLAHPVCRHCQQRPATVVHHVLPIRKRPDLRMVQSNWFAACKPCHDGPLQAAERKQ